ncbi:MAG: site-2 protease family protein [Armatimonadetes bacterium]|nr:site-2 protease family protein [Armatimonadota bacterium]
MLGLDPQTLLWSFGALLIAATVHEFAHAYVADRLGDDTPRRQGRLTLNPIAHLDLIGTLMILLAGFGWAKPVEVNPRNFPDWRRGMLLVALAGPLANVTVIFGLGVLIKLGALDTLPTTLQQFLLVTIWINGVLAVFNLIPIPPLDGAKILEGVLPAQHAWWLARWQPYGILILIVLVYTGITGRILRPAVGALVYLGTGSRWF